jgi:hypothetical protein
VVKPRNSSAIIAIWLATLIAGTACAREPDAYGPLRQRTTQPIPGTLSFVLEPVGDFRPSFDPDAAYANLVERAPGGVTITLATVHDTDFGTTWGPAWVLFARDVCFATSKGDIVSPARSGNDACGDANLWVQAIDARDGRVLGSFTAYDGTTTWMPDREGDPAQVSGTTRFH